MHSSFLNHSASSRPFLQHSDAYIESSDTEDAPVSPTDSDSSFDEDEVNRRITPFWPKYCHVFRARGFRLETIKDVKLYYRNSQLTALDAGHRDFPFYSNQPDGRDDDALCPDAGIPDNLFRGIRLSDSQRVVVKAVHSKSREYNVICNLSRPPLRDDPMNHCIPVLDLFESMDDDIAFIIMEEWSSELIPNAGPCCLNVFLSALRQCIEHIVFMHKHCIAHLDISLRNLLTDYHGHYAYIDYEISRRFDPSQITLVYNYRGTEVPPECESGEGINPFKVDIWALAVLMLRACKLAGYWIPELMHVIEPMLNEVPDRRPSSLGALQIFDKVMSSLGISIGSPCVSH
ncbi:kinase-like protein [Pholiota conissans]|uniref:Kinase-like protein n=1 Tax=Pholiota conissans TaxID=109636 RepID=A0A9P6D3S8_9AGAR|nr:kinase-like protein [Pholiota conissans]